jgi:phospholipid-binding lipoprotein MlaA
MRVKVLSLVLLLSLVLFSGCSSKKEVMVTTIQNESSLSKEQQEEDEFLDEFEEEMKVEEVYDPLEGYNRVMTSFNDGVYEYVLEPVSNGYKAVTNEGVRDSVGNFFHNLFYPIRLVNNLLQGKFANSAEETGRFVINSTIGLFGLFDVAKSGFDLEPHNEDFGQTLGYWGVSGGPHIVLPFLGPSNLRDSLSLYPDSLANPVDYHSDRSYNLTNDFWDGLKVKSFDKINTVAQSNDAYGKMKEDAIDLYPYLRDVYEQYREQQIKE